MAANPMLVNTDVTVTWDGVSAADRPRHRHRRAEPVGIADSHWVGEPHRAHHPAAVKRRRRIRRRHPGERHLGGRRRCTPANPTRGRNDHPRAAAAPRLRDRSACPASCSSPALSCSSSPRSRPAVTPSAASPPGRGGSPGSPPGSCPGRCRDHPRRLRHPLRLRQRPACRHVRHRLRDRHRSAAHRHATGARPVRGQQQSLGLCRQCLRLLNGRGRTRRRSCTT